MNAESVAHLEHALGICYHSINSGESCREIVPRHDQHRTDNSRMGYDKPGEILRQTLRAKEAGYPSGKEQAA